jgi:hypothetical protein
VSGCNSDGCEAAPAHFIHWPGNPPTPLCEPCTERARGIAKAMGFELHTTALANRPHCDFCGVPLPDDRTRYRVRQCCQRGHDRDERTVQRGASGFTAAEFVQRVTVLSLEADELLAEASTYVEPAPEVGCALGALAAAAKVLTMLRECGEPSDWKAIAPCDECGGTVQHRLGCSRD